MKRPLPTVQLAGIDRAVTRIGLGAMLLSLPGRPERGEAKRVIRATVEAGITLIDSADTYAVDQSEVGHNEALIAETLADMGLRVDDGPVVVATKGGRTRHEGQWGHDAHPTHLRKAVEQSLGALRAERLSLYQLHAPDPRVPFEDSVSALALMREEGKIQAIGLSNVSISQIEQARAIVPIATLQNAQSIWDVGYRRSPVVEHCRRAGIVFLAYTPLGGADRAQLLSDNASLSRLAEQYRATPQELALAWLLHESPNVVPIPGASKPSRVESMTRAMSLELSQGAQRRLRAAARTLPGHRSFLARAKSKLARLVST